MVSPMGIIGVFAVILYWLKSLALFTISQRRNIRHPWYAWLPVFRDYQMGSLSDCYQLLTKGKKEIARWMLPLSCLGMICCGVYLYGQIESLPEYEILLSLFTFGIYPLAVLLENWTWVLLYLGVLLISWLMNIVFRWIALNNLFRSCDPESRVRNVVLSLMIPGAESILLFLCRNKDYGLPPKSPEELLESDFDL